MRTAIANCEPLGPTNPKQKRLRITADLLREELRRAPREESSRLWLRHCRIEGGLDLTGCAIAPRLRFESCTFDKELDLEQATIPDLEFHDCLLRGALNANHLSVEWDLQLDRSRLKRLALRGARIGGEVSMAHAEFKGDHGHKGAAIEAQQLQVEGAVVCNGAEVHGEFSIPGTRIGGPLVLEDIVLRSVANEPNACVLNADTAEIGGFLHADGLDADAEVRLCAASIGGQLTLGKAKVAGPLALVAASIEGDAQLSGATLLHPGGTALSADHLRVDISLSLDAGFRAEGDIRLSGGSIGGQLSFVGARLEGQLLLAGTRVESEVLLTDAKLINNAGPALDGNGMRAGAGLIADEGLHASGGVLLRGAKFGGPLVLNEATLTSQAGPALLASNVVVADDMRLSDARITGHLHLLRASIEGELDFSQGRIEEGRLVLQDASVGADLALRQVKILNEDGVSLYGPRLKVGGALIADEGFESGEVLFVGARFGSLRMTKANLTANRRQSTVLGCDSIAVTGNVTCDELKTDGEVRLSGATVGGQVTMRNATLRNSLGIALNAERIEVAHGMYLSDGFGARGDVRLAGARIHSQLSLDQARLTGSPKGTLGLRAAKIDELLLLADRITGSVDLRQATVEILSDTREGRLIGLPDGPMRLEGFSYRSLHEPLDAERRNVWLQRSQAEGYRPGVYAELVSALRRVGHNRDARKIAVYGERRAHNELRRLHPRRGWHNFLFCTVGYGYYNWFALIWLVGLIALGGLIFGLHESDFTKTLEEGPDLDVWLYSIDATVPILEVGQQRAWTTEGCLAWFATALSIAGYALVTAVIAASAGLLARDQR